MQVLFLGRFLGGFIVKLYHFVIQTKCAHHGSKTSSSKSFIDALSPDIALISAGVNNRYGHPHNVTLDTLENAGCDIYRTNMCHSSFSML